MTVELPGRVQALRTAQIRARVEGVLERQMVPDGTEVVAGTRLFRIEPRAYQAAFDAAEAEYASQQATLARYQKLLSSRAVSEQEFDAAKAREKVAAATLEKARLDLEHAQPRSPINGRAGRALLTEGALVGKGEATLLMTVEQLHPIRVEFSQSYADVLLLKKQVKSDTKSLPRNAAIALLLDDGSEYSQPGVLRFNDMAVDPTTGSVTLRAEFANPERTLLPGTFVRVRLPVAVREGVLRVPQRAVTTSVQGQSVMVVDDQDKVAQRAIVTQGMAGTDYLVAEGLKPGERVIVNGLQKVRPNTVVKPVLVTDLKRGGATPSPTPER
ncbi:MAG: efflux RND transporter periplasmic adaptor subunit [Rhodocyclaceae bacterium]|nr:efflux RND transporter periplasmic adaptor subunit [Rhodocyclaceae bacterium]MBK6908777.1 efflux RND transporter periplasmic adaptor subunit [Rhodocyclaceae bacterium]